MCGMSLPAVRAAKITSKRKPSPEVANFLLSSKGGSEGCKDLSYIGKSAVDWQKTSIQEVMSSEW